MLELFHMCFSSAAPDISGYYRGAASGLRRHMRNRAADPAMKVLDLHYMEVVAEPHAAIEKVYDFCDVPLTEASLGRMLDWNARNPKDAKGRHIYTLEQYDFSEEQIEKDFAEYFEFVEERVGRR